MMLVVTRNYHYVIKLYLQAGNQRFNLYLNTFTKMLWNIKL